LTKSDCDEQFKVDLLQVCSIEQPNGRMCDYMAESFYLAVKFFGEKSWQCSNTQLHYKSEETNVNRQEKMQDILETSHGNFG